MISDIDRGLHPRSLFNSPLYHTFNPVYGSIFVCCTMANQIIIQKENIFAFYFIQFIEHFTGSTRTILIAQIFGYGAKITIKWAAARGLNGMPQITRVQQVTTGFDPITAKVNLRTCINRR
jgi:hypothetical protein